MTVRSGCTVEPVAGFHEIRPEWSLLAERTRNVFSSWEWAEAWWRHFHAGSEPRIVLLRGDAGNVVGIVPLYRQGGSLPLDILRFIGSGVADQLGPVAAEEDVQRIVSSIGAAVPRGVILAERLSPNQSWTAFGGRELRREASPAIDLTGGWDAYLARRSRNFRQQARRRARNIQRRAGVRFRLADDERRLSADFDAMVRLHTARWGGTSIAFTGPRYLFHREFASTALRAGWLRLWLAEVRGAVVAAWYGFRFGGIESFYQLGRDPAWDRYGVGTALLEHSIREAAADGMSEYRLLRGDERYKQRYATESTYVTTVAVPFGAVSRAGVAALAEIVPRVPTRFLRRFAPV
jgi:CelD/BcsL family acetyltransferase involved in cellulose biosynthesis